MPVNLHDGIYNAIRRCNKRIDDLFLSPHMSFGDLIHARYKASRWKEAIARLEKAYGL